MERNEEQFSTFPIDLVLTWVDGSQPQHYAKRQQALGASFGSSNSNKALADTNHANRFESHQEVYQVVLSAQCFAPWLRYIHVVVDDDQVDWFWSQCPDEVLHQMSTETKDKLRLVKHSDIFVGHTECLPCFNSHAIEANVGYIPELSECFLYGNDDTFFGKPVVPDLFFDKLQKPKVCFGNILIASGRPSPHTDSWLWGRQNNWKLLNVLRGLEQSGRVTQVGGSGARTSAKQSRFDLIHQIRPMRKEWMWQAWQHPLLSKHFLQTTCSKFRSLTDIEPIGLILHWKSDCKQVSLIQLNTRVFSLQDSVLWRREFASLKPETWHLYCINDDLKRVDVSKKQDIIQFLQSHLPHHSYRNNSNNKQKVPNMCDLSNIRHLLWDKPEVNVTNTELINTKVIESTKTETFEPIEPLETNQAIQAIKTTQIGPDGLCGNSGPAGPAETHRINTHDLKTDKLKDQEKQEDVWRNVSNDEFQHAFNHVFEDLVSRNETLESGKPIPTFKVPKSTIPFEPTTPLPLVEPVSSVPGVISVPSVLSVSSGSFESSRSHFRQRQICVMSDIDREKAAAKAYQPRSQNPNLSENSSGSKPSLNDFMANWSTGGGRKNFGRPIADKMWRNQQHAFLMSKLRPVPLPVSSSRALYQLHQLLLKPKFLSQ